jgi:acetyl-CoA carboxylase carboxyltransferase component
MIMSTMTDPELEQRRRRAVALGGPERVAGEHARGRYTIRERIERLVDPGSFREIATLTTLPIVNVHGEVVDVLATPYVGGMATIDGRPVVVGGEDFTINYGAPSQHLEKFKGGFSGHIEELAFEHRLPLVLLLHGAGGDVGFADAVGYTAVPSAHDVFPMAEMLEVAPVVCAVLGVVGGGAGVRAVASHLSVMSRPQGLMFAAGPAIVERALGQRIDKAALGNVDMHVAASGNVDNIAEDEDDAFAQIRRFLAFLPTNVHHLPPTAATGPTATRPSDAPGDPAAVIATIVDEGTWFPIGDDYGRSLRTGLARIAGRTVGILAHDARVNEGRVDGLAADKQVRFVQMCDLFHVPIVFLVDTPGVLSTLEAESDGVLRRVVRAVEAMHRVRVPVLTVHVGRCDGLAGMATSPANRTALRIGWPSASFGTGGDLSTMPAIDDPWLTAEHLGIEEIIEPAETRAFLESWLTFNTEITATTAGPTSGRQYRP